MNTGSEIRDAVINTIVTSNAIENLVIHKGIKEPVKNYVIISEPGVVLVRHIGGYCEENNSQKLQNNRWINAGQNRVFKIEIYIGYQTNDKFLEEDIDSITNSILEILSNSKVGLDIKPFVCTSQPEYEVKDNNVWQKLIFETKQTFKGSV